MDEMRLKLHQIEKCLIHPNQNNVDMCRFQRNRVILKLN